jgi:hypothetical protein
VADDVPRDETAVPGRDLLLVALRLMGLWFIFGGVTAMPVVFAQCLMLMPSSPSNFQQVAMALSGTLTVATRLIVGVLVVVFSGRIASKFYPHPAENSGEIRFGRIGAGDLFQIASFALGIYALLQMVSPAIRLVERLMAGSTYIGTSAIYDVVLAGVFFVSGLLLVFGARRIAQFMANLRYDPDTLPSQQISLWVLLALIAVVAIVLGLMRAFVA